MLQTLDRPPAAAIGERTASRVLERCWARGAQFLVTSSAILGGAMSWLSEHTFVSALCNAGAFGVLAAGGLSAEELAGEIELTRAATDRPFGVNLVVVDQGFIAQFSVCKKLGVTHLVIGGGTPRTDVFAQAKRAGARMICFAGSPSMAIRLVRSGADALIVEGHEAGGHVGPVSTTVLVQQMLPIMDHVPVFVAGGIGRGATIAHYLLMGAAGCQLGTRFSCARESRMHPATKSAYMRASAHDATLSVQLDPLLKVLPVRAIENDAKTSFINLQREVLDGLRLGEISVAAARFSIENFWAGRLKRAVIHGDVKGGSLMAGQSIAFVTEEEPVVKIHANLVAEAEAELTRLTICH
jgi:enoyl-[acyl-carrier protein] reductase II